CLRRLGIVPPLLEFPQQFPHSGVLLGDGGVQLLGALALLLRLRGVVYGLADRHGGHDDGDDRERHYLIRLIVIVAPTILSGPSAPNTNLAYASLPWSLFFCGSVARSALGTQCSHAASRLTYHLPKVAASVQDTRLSSSS